LSLGPLEPRVLRLGYRGLVKSPLEGLRIFGWGNRFLGLGPLEPRGIGPHVFGLLRFIFSLVL